MNHISDFKIYKGRIHFVDSKNKYIEFEDKLIKVDTNNKKSIIFSEFTVLKYLPFYIKYKRLLRKGVHHFIPLEDDKGFIIKDNYTAIVEGEKLLNKTNLKGSRPLKICEHNKDIYYGVYKANPNRVPIPLMKLKELNEWISVYTFNGITHIHGVFYDKYEDKFWVTVGDENDEAAIYKFNKDWSSPEKVIYGSQQARAIVVLFDKDYFYYGTDTPYDKNFIYQIRRDDHKIVNKTSVNASIFHGCSISDWKFFSTAIEPSEINKSKYASIYASKQGGEWKRVFKVKKDIWDMRYFQYGQIFFPYGNGDNENLWFSLFATKKDNRTLGVSLEKLNDNYQSNKVVTIK